MTEDIKTVEGFLKLTDDQATRIALSKLRDILVAWKGGKYLVKNTEAKAYLRLMRGA